MWQPRSEVLDGARGRRLTVDGPAGPLSWADMLRGWRALPELRSLFGQALAAVPYGAIHWETPPLTDADLERPFECVCLDGPTLAATRADARDFGEHFERAAPEQQVLCFPNLGGDALLVAPCPRAPAAVYAHLASFLRGAPEAQQHALWRAVAEAVEQRLGPDPLWLNTAGLGVLWLHVRVDSRPKYYRHAPYAV